MFLDNCYYKILTYAWIGKMMHLGNKETKWGSGNVDFRYTNDSFGQKKYQITNSPIKYRVKIIDLFNAHVEQSTWYWVSFA